MKKNMGTIDRIIRIIIGLGLLVTAIILAVTNPIIWLMVVTGVFGLILLVTSLLGFCPLYLPFHINTGKKK